MHLSSRNSDLAITTGIVGAVLPIVNGFALAEQLRHVDKVRVYSFGDGAPRSLPQWRCDAPSWANMLAHMPLRIRIREAALARTLAALLSFGAVGLQAQENGGRTVYGREQLQALAANHAEELLQRIPGAAAVLDQASTTGGNPAAGVQRGLGAAGPQLLIDGRRIASKTSDLAAYLRRIDAAQVERIELLRDSAGGLDVASQGVVVNIVLKPGPVARDGSLTAEFNSHFTSYGRREYDGLLSTARALGAANVVFSVERTVRSPNATGPIRYSNRSRDERYYFPSGALQELRPQEWTREVEKYLYSAELSHGNETGGLWHVNASYDDIDFVELAETPFVRFDVAGAEVLRATDIQRRNARDRSAAELGADYETRLGAGELKLVSIFAQRVMPTVDQRDRIVGNRVLELNRSDIDQKIREAIVRGSFAFPAFGQRIELGTEVARNRLTQLTQLSADNDGDGLAESIPIPEPDATVTELRSELFAKLNAQHGERLTAETSLTGEFSRITSSYALFPPRDYFFLKPRVDLRYALSDRDQLGLLLERKVSQLQFENFVPTYDVLSNRLLAGNPGIAPEKSNNVELRIDHRFAEDGGDVGIKLFLEAIRDAIDRDVIGTDARGNLFSAPSNIGDASASGIELKFSLRLDRLGLPNALLSGRAKRQTTKVTDPFTGLTRQIRFRFPEEYELGFRQDLRSWRMSYGFDFHAQGGALDGSEVLVRETFRIGPRLDGFLEKKVGSRLTVRLEGQHLAGAHEFRRRTIFADNQIVGTVLRRESYDESRDRRFVLKLRLRF